MMQVVVAVLTCTMLAFVARAEPADTDQQAPATGVEIADDYDPLYDVDADPADDDAIDEWDPWEGFNRKIFWFNEKADRFVLEPTAKGWDWIMPDPVQHSVRKFFLNVGLPIVMVHNVLQGKPSDAATDAGRFLVNTTVGVVGLFDPATGWGLERHDEDFGQTLAVWGVGPGPYLVLPMLGPSNIRDGIGTGVDAAAAVWPFFAPFGVSFGVTVLTTVNSRSLVIDEIAEARAASLDFYIAARNAFGQRRRLLIADSREEGLYDPADLYFEPAR